MAIRFLTCARYPDGTPDDRLWARALRARGETVEFWPWETGVPDGTAIFRSVWNYVGLRARFLEFLADLRGPVFNPAEAVRWNLDKRYLLDLEAEGIPIVPTVAGDAPPPKAREWVVKPAVSASAHNTFRVAAEGLAAALDAVRAEGVPLVQPFLPEIVENGEWSLVYFRGTGVPSFSHAVLKKPGPGDFRVQEEYGGSAVRAEPHGALAALAAKVLPYLERFDWLYLRLDAVVVEGRALVAELELFEPHLFFGLAPGAEKIAVRALLEKR